MIRLRVAFFVGATVLLLGACDSTTPQSELSTTVTTSNRPSIAVSVPSAPTQHNNGRQDVGFDPCAGIADDVISRAGFDPNTRKRSDFIFDTYSFIGCSFDHKEQVRGQWLTVRTLTVFATNITLEEFRNREGKGATETTVNGRDAMTYNTTNAGSCNVAMVAPNGVINVRTGTNAAFTTERPCDRINEVSAIIESVLGD